MSRADFPDVRAWLRSVRMADMEPADTAAPGADADPREIFLDWLESAVEAGVAEPHTAVLSTVDPGGRPDARVLLLRDVTTTGWWFSGPAYSPKGAALKANPVGALTFYWCRQGRQVRVRGTVCSGDEATTARDFLERSPTARAVGIASLQSEVLAAESAYDDAVAAAASRVAADPDFVPEHWRAWCLQPDAVEFWQADPGRRHRRWRYLRTESGWLQDVLWP